LGEFRERVIKLLTKEQVVEPGIYHEIAKALEDKRSKKMVINGSISHRLTDKYQKLAEKMGKEVTIISDPDLAGDAGLVVASNDAADAQDIYVRDRGARLEKLGIPQEIIDAAGKKVCEKCLEKVLEADPDESINYKKVTLAEHFWGEKCSACKR
ncbi:MAG: YueI family protein, partial [Firmicutes bacterium]|nr:YueI family protein [Bacillota bacterium]